MLGYDDAAHMNSTPVSTPLDVAEQAERFGGRTALQLDQRQLTFGELAREVESVKPRALRSSGPCAILANGDLGALTALYACLSERRSILLISPSVPDVVRRRLLERVGVTDCYSEQGWSEHCAPASSERPLDGDDVLLPTSGTTGEPKIVCLSQEALVASASVSNGNLNLDEEGRWALTLPYAHVGGLAILVRCALAGSAVVSRTYRFDTPEDVGMLQRDRISHLSLVPTQLHRALQRGARAPRSLRAVLVGGASSPPVLRARARRAGWPVAFTYGFTEAASQVATQELGREPADTPERDVGHPLKGTEVALSGSGRLAVRGPTLMNRYWGAPARKPDDWFVTEDIAHWDESDRLVIEGRADNMIISGGENVAAERVEEALATLPFIEEAVVFGVPDDRWGHRIVALVAGDETPLEDIRAALRDQLEPYALPKETVFCGALPRLPTGKLDRRAAESRLIQLRPNLAIDR